jgi:hypothetical protein
LSSHFDDDGRPDDGQAAADVNTGPLMGDSADEIGPKPMMGRNRPAIRDQCQDADMPMMGQDDRSKLRVVQVHDGDRCQMMIRNPATAQGQ